MLFKNLFAPKTKKHSSVIVVSGLPRSGTSMMMQILQAGGIQPITDSRRTADQNNRKGYYEHEGVKALAQGQHACLEGGEGRALKVVSNLLKYLPTDRHYKVIFMRRDLDEILNSQAAMLGNLHKKVDSTEHDQRLKTSYNKHLNSVVKWMGHRNHIQVLSVDYATVLAEPIQEIRRVAEFLEILDSMPAMIACVDRNMRRQHII